GGYYDRFFTLSPLFAIRVGVGFHLQICPDLPADPHDARMHWIVTEHGWTPCATVR
ncbi:MAG: 5-formyltetrahydrofolate cyclo-ligase, partial [Alicyclobacillus sp.]|nr:5-formyltetrahydrofolate cyclo-ligase [Alicyclobacillus sp.]